MTDATPATPEAPWPVGTLSAKLREYIDRLGTVWVEGELTQWNVSAGNAYGKLKDLGQDATISITAWRSVRERLPQDLKQGDRVIALVKPDFWVKGGTLSMQVFDLRHVGLGDLLERLERLRAQLAKEGLFDADRKVPLPFLPQCIGLVTSAGSDAEKDVVRNAQLRWPNVRIRTHHAQVQGDRAVGEVIAGIRTLDADPEVDVIIVARGGGDFQHLLVFSDEALVRAAAACATPLVSAIGHENDRPLLDEVADLRASTPTDAAKRVVPDVAEELLRVRQARTRMLGRLSHLVGGEIDRIGALRSRPVLASGDWLVDRRAEELTRWVARGTELVDRSLERAHTRVAELRGQLAALSPMRTLERGYAIALGPDGRAIRRAAEAPGGTAISVRLAEGAIAATVDADGPVGPPSKGGRASSARPPGDGGRR